MPTFEHVRTACAKAAHEANKAYCEAIGDHSQLPWDQAAEWQRTSSLEGVDNVFAGKTPEQLHELWCQSKLDAGWKYGVEKNGDAKTHPCLVPYSHLPDFQKKKDALLSAVVRGVAAALGFPVGDALMVADSFKVTTRPA